MLKPASPTLPAEMAQEEAPSYRFLSLLNYALVILMGLGWNLIGPALPAMRNEFSLSVASVGIVFPLATAGFALAVMIAGYVVDSYGRRPVLVGTSLMLGLGYLGWGLAPHWTVMAGIMFFTGAGLGCIDIITNVTTSDASSGDRVADLNRLHMFFGLSAVLSPLLIGLSLDVNWRLPMIAIGLLGFACLPLTFRVQLPQAASIERLSRDNVIPLARNGLITMITAVLVLYIWVEVSLIGWGVTYVTEVFQEPYGQSTMLVSLFWGAIFLGRLAIVWLSRRLTTEQIMQIPLIASVPLILVVGLAPSVLVIYAAVFLLGLCLAPVFPTMFAVALQRFPRRPGTVAIVLLLGAALGGLLPPYVIGVLAENLSFRIAMLSLVPIALFMPFLTHFAFRRARQGTDAA
ncbi:MAG: MFS transporter [Chloroflexota bacterium]|nr:MFS transporter [Chloroflexota bacterium]MDE2929733.1 MFS transporter [Chloroflexota bacterium]